ncbi:MAG: hypothetical protein IJ364_02540 [Oscillospiraceae bacterium]|nr:hypothetical protein [Oscillospiraceae bacterium]
MDIKEKVQEIVEKIKADKDFAANFKKDPVKTVEKLIGVELPEDQINSLITMVKAKVDIDAIGSLLDKDGDGKPDLGGLGKLGGLFK